MSIEKELEELEQARIESLTATSEKEKTSFHIGVTLSELMQAVKQLPTLAEQAEKLKSKVLRINEETPTWFWIVPDIKKDKKGTVTKVGYKSGYDHVNMGNQLIKKFHLVRYPKLREGAVYNYSRGYWRYFGKNEMKDFVEKETLHELEKWGFYDIQRIPPTRIYVLQKTYDEAYPNATPFETSKPELVVFRNGTYNMLTDKMQPHDPKDFILNAYDYNLDMSGRATPHTNNLFSGLVGENSLFLKQFIGYMFYRSYAPAQEMLFLKGNGGEGKSSFIAYLSNYILGSDNVSAITPQDLSNDRFQIVELLGKSANISADILDDYIEDSSILKRLTGGDPVYAQFKGIQGFKMLNYAKMLFSANKLPKFKDHTDGFSNRLAVVPFINGNQRNEGATFWKEHSMEKVEAESKTFAYSCMREFMKIFDGKKAQFTKSASMEKEKSKWLLDNDHIAEFIIEATEINLKDRRGEISSTVQKEYKAFCVENNYNPKSPQAVRDYLEKLGVIKERSRSGFDDGNSSQWRYIGLRITKSFLSSFD